VAHEQTVTFKIKNKWIVAPSVIDGIKYSEDEVKKLFKQGKAAAFFMGTDFDEAQEYAKERSKGFDIMKGMHKK
jgi:ABC-type glycerol-3-phosphate transport system substrate-binding protein